MDGLPVTRRRPTVLRTLCGVAAAVTVLGAAASCSAGSSGDSTGTASAPSAGAGPVTAEISQFRDNYSKRIIEIQLTNTTSRALTVLGAELTSPLFAGPVTWPGSAGGIELPPGQAKSLPAPLPAPDCGSPAATNAGPGDASGQAGPTFVSLRLVTPEGTAPPTSAAPVLAADPFGVLARNNAEMCVALEAAKVATIRMAPELEVSADGRTAVVRLLMTPRPKPRDGGGAADAGATGLVIDRIEETTLLAESPVAPWPRGVTLRPGAPPSELRLGIRPARCDPHAVAEDKVGTLLPLQVRVAGRQGVLKIDSGDKLRVRIYEFVTTACGRQ